MDTIKYAIRRNGIYHFNIRLSNKVYRKSLKTDSPSVCKSQIKAVIYFIKCLKLNGIIVTKEDIDQFIEQLIKNRASEVIRLSSIITNPFSNTANEYFSRWYKQTKEARNDAFELDWHGVSDVVPRPQHATFKDWLNDKIVSASKDYSKLTDEYVMYDSDNDEWQITNQKLHDALRFPTEVSVKESYLSDELSNHVNNLVLASKQNNLIKFRLELEELCKRFAIENSKYSKIETTKHENKTPLVRELESAVCDYWYKSPKLSNQQTITKYEGILCDFVFYFSNVHVNELTFKDIEEFWNVYLLLPKINIGEPKRKHYGFHVGKGAENKKKERQLRFDIVERDSVTIEKNDVYGKEMCKSLRTVINDFFFVCSRNGHIESKPNDKAELIVPKEKRVLKRTALPDEQVLKIVQYCESHLNQDKCAWAILIMAYHGLRNSEVAALRKEEVVFDHGVGVWYFNITSGKTANAIRKVPIHSRLLKLNFLEYVSGIKDGQSLFNLKSSNLTNRFNLFREKFDIDTLNDAGELQNLYSLRHSVISKLNTVVNNEHLYRLLGHSHNKTSTIGYTKADMLLYQETINKIYYYS